MMDEAEADVLAYFCFPKAHHEKIHSVNMLERLNKEAKRRGHLPQRINHHAATGCGITLMN